MPDLPETPGSRPGLEAALADRYLIERELGRGGMAVVYLARDVKHDRQVAIKVLSSAATEGVKAERFLREIQIAAKLSHAHILPLHDSGEAAGFLYYVMPYVEGESLRDRLVREQQLPLADALQITRDVASALSYAHQHDVVHRDIKPENILLSGGEAVVADFGIARALRAAGGGSVTETGLAVGTPAYMSPEQANGGASPGLRPGSVSRPGLVDGRSDIYSLGCVLFEMLAGHPPFSGATAQEILARHALDPVPSLQAARPGVPRIVERAVAKALAKVPADRFATAGEFASALAASRRRSPVFVAAGLLVLVGGGIVARQTLLRSPSEQSVAVLPFVNLSGDSAQEYFSDGMSEELINALVQVNGLRVPARTSAFAFKGKNADIREIGRQLNVSNVVEGSVRRAGNRVHVTAQLIKVADGYHLWSETYDREVRLRDVIGVQEEIARAIVGTLRIRLVAAESAALISHHSDNPDAYDLYLRGRYFQNKGNRKNIEKAIAYFREAVEKDSSYALAYSGLADAYISAGGNAYLPRADAYPLGNAAAVRALRLDSTLAEAHVSLARVWSAEWNWPAAEGEVRRAIALNPRYAPAHILYGQLLSTYEGRLDDGLREERIGAELDPLSPAANSQLGALHLNARQYDGAIRYARRALELEPNTGLPYRILGGVYREKGLLSDAMREYELDYQAAAKAGQWGGTPLALTANIYARMGKRAEALALLDSLRARSVLGYIVPDVEEAIVYLGLRDNDRVFAALERSVAAHRSFLWRDPLWDPVRSDPRWAPLLRKVGVVP